MLPEKIVPCIKFHLMKRFWILFCVAVSMLPVSCDKEDDDPEDEPTPTQEVQVSVYPVYGGAALKLDSTYTTSENYHVQFTDLKFFLTQLQNNGKTLIPAARFDYRELGNSLFKCPGNAGDFANINGILGVDSITNHADPANIPNDSPLNASNCGGMYWGWNPGYIFIIVEARVDTIPDAIDHFDHLVSFHIGNDPNKKMLSFSSIPWTQSSAYLSTARLKLDLQQFLTGPQPIHLNSEFLTHSNVGQESLTAKVLQNFSQSLSFF